VRFTDDSADTRNLELQEGCVTVDVDVRRLDALESLREAGRLGVWRLEKTVVGVAVSSDDALARVTVFNSLRAAADAELERLSPQNEGSQ
jgi:hypothetical protein